MESAIRKALSFGGNVGRSIKKVRRRPEEPPDSDNPIVDNKGMKFISKRMAWTVIVKLLERRVSYLTMSNKLQAICKTKQPLQIIDLENDYFSVKFQEDNEYLDALFKGPWTIFVAKIDRNIDNNVRGKFVWLVVYMDLEKPLCGRFGHNRENCPHKTGQGSASKVEVNQQLNRGLRMLVDSIVEWASSLDPKNNPFDDGSRMGPIVLDKDLEAIHFQAFSPEPASFTGGDSLSLPIALVIDDILQGLSNKVGDDIAMVDVLRKEIGEEDETIVDVEST
ncbi:hypothetical protein Golax_019679 [Gossypium laxum]|uniref:DUF4283 domain-containing protein n=1 Tax=Gossypium laxum TaxID=34288 RepID=A0A7J8Z7S6_9ROSI|nr:hypothetical protein [Gossypium laxum]